MVVGGGYAGVMAANRLRKSDAVEVTLINPRADFVERIRLHQLVGGSHPAVLDYREILNDRVQVIVDRVDHIDAATRTVMCASGASRTYDYLIYAVGSTSTSQDVPGAEHAYPVAGLEQATVLRDRLEAVPLTASITVVGAGPTGIETAAELAETGRPVTLICGDQIGPYLHERGRRALLKRLAALSVTIVQGPGAVVRAVAVDRVSLADGREVHSALTIWTAGFGVPDLARRSGLATDAIGRLLTDETLTSVDDPRIVAAGDAADPSGHPMRMSCQAAIPLGAQAAETVLSRIADQAAVPVNSGFVAQCLSLGRRTGLLQFARSDDSARGLYLSGRAAAGLKEAVCKAVVGSLRAEARRPGKFRWPKDRGRSARTDQQVPTSA